MGPYRKSRVKRVAQASVVAVAAVIFGGTLAWGAEGLDRPAPREIQVAQKPSTGGNEEERKRREQEEIQRLGEDLGQILRKPGAPRSPDAGPGPALRPPTPNLPATTPSPAATPPPPPPPMSGAVAPVAPTIAPPPPPIRVPTQPIPVQRGR